MVIDHFSINPLIYSLKGPYIIATHYSFLRKVQPFVVVVDHLSHYLQRCDSAANESLLRRLEASNMRRLTQKPNSTLLVHQSFIRLKEFLQWCAEQSIRGGGDRQILFFRKLSVICELFSNFAKYKFGMMLGILREGSQWPPPLRAKILTLNFYS